MPKYKNYLLTVLMVIMAFNNVDRVALGLLLQDIKVDLELSDTQLGFLTGIAFALFYSVMGIPIARWADRGNRVTIIAITTALWSAAVVLCGLVGSFLHLLLIRVGVGVGEAGCTPPALSLIADYFPRAERPRAIARYMLNAPLGYLIGFALAGWLSEHYGWRMMFVLLGLPGLALAALARLTLGEPRRGNSTPEVAGRLAASSLSSPHPSLQQVWATLWANRTFRHLLIAFGVLSFFGQGILQWKAAFFVRSYGLQTAELGTWLAAIYGIGGLLGTYWGGELASRRAAHNEALQLKVMAFVYCSFGVVSACVYLSPNHYFAFGFMTLATVGVHLAVGPLFATLQTLVAERMRAMSLAIVYLVANLIGLGLGPLAAGALSDALRPLVGEESLRYALLTLCPGYVWTAWHLWRASRTVTLDVGVLQVDREGGSVHQENSLENAAICVPAKSSG